MAQLPSKQQAILDRIREKARLAREAKATQEINKQQELANTPLAQETELEEVTEEVTERVSMTSANINFNEDQQQAIEYAAQGKSFCLIGAAGTGKTTTTKGMVEKLMQRLRREGNVPSDAIRAVAFTNRAVRNIARALTSINANYYCMTIHKCLGFHPERFDIVNDETGDITESMRFVPLYTADNPLSTKLCIVEESSMVDTRLFKQLKDAMPEATFIFIGDLNQLKPVFGDAILGFMLAELPVVELTKVYRQAMESPIVAFQHNFTLQSKLPGDTILTNLSKASNDKLNFFPLQKEFKDLGEKMAEGLAKFITNEFEAGNYKPFEDIVLIPFNKAFGSIHMNAHIAQYFSEKEGQPVYEIIAGREKKYFAEGDFVIFNKEEWKIEHIEPNKSYLGPLPQIEGVKLDRFGINHDNEKLDIHKILDDSISTADINALLKTTDGNYSEDLEEVKAQASHKVTLINAETGDHITLQTRGEINTIDFGYVITVHKSQGSEWRKVYFIMTNSHAVMLNKELIYTGMTRAREKLVVIYSPQTAIGRKNSSVAKAIGKASIPGLTWQEKAKFFKGKLTADTIEEHLDNMNVPQVPPKLETVIEKTLTILQEDEIKF